MQDDFFDNNIRNTLSQGNQTPPNDMWARIDAKRKKRNKKGIVLWWLSAAILLVGLIYLVPFDNTSNQALQRNFSNNEVNLPVGEKASLPQTVRNDGSEKVYRGTNSKTEAMYSAIKNDGKHVLSKKNIYDDKQLTALNLGVIKGIQSESDISTLKVAGNEVADLTHLKPLNFSLKYFLNQNLMEPNYKPLVFQGQKFQRITFELSAGVAVPINIIKGIDSISNIFIERRKDASTFALQNNVQFRLGYKFDKYYFKTGINLMQWHEQFNMQWYERFKIFDKIDTVTYTVLQPFQPPLYLTKIDSVFIHTDSSYKVNHDVKYKSVMLPIEVGRQWHTGRFTYALQAGVSVQWLKAHGNVALPLAPYHDDVNNVPYVRRNINLQSHVSVIAGFNTSEQWMVFIKPEIAYMGRTTSLKSFYRQHVFAPGIQIGISYTPIFFKSKQRFLNINPLTVSK
jgi:hypothetical protein